MHKFLSIILLFLAAMEVSSAPAAKVWQSDPGWVRARYGDGAAPASTPSRVRWTR